MQVILVGQKGSVPETVKDIIQVVPDLFEMTIEQVRDHLAHVQPQIPTFIILPEVAEELLGLNLTQIYACVTQAVLDLKLTPNEPNEPNELVRGVRDMSAELVRLHRNRLFPAK